MATLNIQGRRVKVDDSFLNLSPEQQHATVDEIASQMGNAAPQMPAQDVANGAAEMGQMTSGFQQAPQEDTERLIRANLEATKLDTAAGRRPDGPGTFADMTDAAQKAALFNFGDELYSGTLGGVARMARDGVGYKEAYKREQALFAAQDRKRQERSPVAEVIGSVAGGLGSAGTLAKGGLTLLGRASGTAGKYAAAAGEGAAYGGLYGAGDDSGSGRFDNATRGAAIGAATGGLLEGAGNIAGKLLAPKGPAAQTSQELASQGRALYDTAANAGVSVKPAAINNAAGNVTMKLKSFGFDKDLQPKTAVVAKKLLEARGKPLSLNELDNIRKMASGVAREHTAAASDRAASRLIVESIDNLVDNTANFSAGSKQAIESLKQAREVWKRKMKTETIEDLVEKAQNQATGFENGLVIQMRTLANNKKKLGAFSQAEQKMIKDVVRRGSAHGVMRAVGMLAPNSTFGGLIAGGTAVGSGIIPGAALAGAGAIAKAGAGALTRGKVANLQRAVSRGQTPSMLSLPNYLRPAIGGTTAGATGLLQQ